MIIKQNTVFAGEVSAEMGSLEIPRDYDESTLAIVALTTATTWTTSMKNRIDDFIVGLKDAGLWELITEIYSPKFFGGLADVGINIRSGSLRTIPNLSGLTFDTSNGITDYNASLAASFPVTPSTYNNLHYGCLNSTPQTSGTYLIGPGNWGYGRKAYTGGVPGIFYVTTAGQGKLPLDSQTVNSSGLVLASFGSEIGIFADADGQQYSPSVDATTLVSGTSMSSLAMYPTADAYLSYLTYGKAFTLAQMAVYRVLINSFTL